MFAAQTYLSVDQKTDCGSVSTMEDKQYWCEQWVLAHREGNVTEEKKYVAKKKCNNLFIVYYVRFLEYFHFSNYLICVPILYT